MRRLHRVTVAMVYGTTINACIGVGRLLGHPSCTPYNHFGPDKVVSGA